MKLLIHWLISTVAIIVTAYLLPGVSVSTLGVAFIVALVLGLINVVLRPVLILLTLPLTIVTFGLFLLVLNALLIMLASSIVRGFDVAGFWWAFLFAIVLSLVHGLLQGITKDRSPKGHHYY